MNVKSTPQGMPDRGASPRRTGGASENKAGVMDLVGSSSGEGSFAQRLNKVASTNEAAERSSRSESTSPRERPSPKSSESEARKRETGPVDVKEEPVEKTQAQAAPNDQGKQVSPEAESGDRSESVSDTESIDSSELAGRADEGASLMSEAPQSEGSVLAEEATEIICSSITVVSQTLNIKVSEDVYHLDLESPSEGVVNEIAEILYALKGIAGLMEGAAKEGRPLEIRDRQFNLQEISQTERLIRHEVFRIECAVNMLGVAGEIAGKVAEKFGSPADGGIPQAVDLSVKAMPQAHLDQVLSQTTEPDSDQVNVLFERLAAVLRRQETKTGVRQSAPDSVRRLFAQTQPFSPREVAPLEPRVMRALLKIDGAEPTIVENVKAAKQTETMDLSKSLSINFGRSLSVESVQVDVGQDTGAIRSASPTMNPLSGAGGSRLALVLQQVEQSVLNQVTERFNTMLRTGTNELRVMLRPESLGEVQLKVQMEGDVVMAKISVESQQVKQIVENNLQSLKDALAEHNLETGSFSVSVDSGGADTQEGEMASEAHAHGPATSESDNRHETDASEATEESGSETGRRYGNNTVEYYA